MTTIHRFVIEFLDFWTLALPLCTKHSVPTVVRLKGAEVVCTLLCEVTISSICKSFVFFHPLESWGVSNPYQSNELFVFEKCFCCFLDVGATWRKKIVCFKLKPDVSFIILHDYNGTCRVTMVDFSMRWRK